MPRVKKQEFSIIIPAYNEAAGISEFLEKLIKEVKKHKEYSAEIIVVNDGSIDETFEKASAFEDVTVITHKHNKG